MHLLHHAPPFLHPTPNPFADLASQGSTVRWPQNYFPFGRSVRPAQAALSQSLVPPMDGSEPQGFSFPSIGPPVSRNSVLNAVAQPVKEKSGVAENSNRDAARVQSGSSPNPSQSPSSGKDRVQNSNGASSRVQGLRGAVETSGAMGEADGVPLNRTQIRQVRAFARTGQGYGDDETALNPDRPLPLPMTFPGSEPKNEEEVEKMLECDPEIVDCPDVVYQWTDKCERCRGTGLTDVRRKKGKSTIGTCLMCSGLGYSQRFTIRDDIPLMGDGNSKL
eukprot:TRINITY_DN11656_c0_g2_i1.p1 TRINITY_DN11656_c0_g2~~TRINITY_DN11656_c0_g2_i1.p1  ORF type:complete len:277 (+),score=42.72 TRINITY_DN11656_c0_g2_i1:282-1112(+)